MDVKCEYCDGFFDDQLENCPNCGATNKNIRRVSNQIPKTIDELKKYCADNKVPLAQMHFHIGEDYKGAKAFGIYRDGENVIVYKNKADGSRAVRYNGKDEAYAVNEIYQKLRSEYAGHKSANMKAPSRAPKNNAAYQARLKEEKRKKAIGRLILFFVGLFIIFCIGYSLSQPSTGYYTYNGGHYYNQRGSWYLYDDQYNDWIPSSMPYEDMDDYYESSSYSSDYGGYDFSDSDYYEEYSYDSDSGSSSSWDDDDSWDSWDSGSDWDWDSGSDWDSDW